MDSETLSKFTKRELLQMCKERNIGKKYKGIYPYQLKKSDLVEFIISNPTKQTLTKEEELLKLLEKKLKEIKELQVENNILKYRLDYYISRFSEDESDIEDHSPPPLERDNVADNLKCPVCLECKINIALTCTHTLCSECEEKLDECPICRKDIDKDKIRYFRI